LCDLHDGFYVMFSLFAVKNNTRNHEIKDDDAGVQLLCTVSSLPFFNLTEQSRSSNNKFALKIRSESSV
uniref:Ovule protein n=1 Tax=Angiostrongylus cantonensis TaxID=6313 RepID=A0A0K0D899_ANGCA